MTLIPPSSAQVNKKLIGFCGLGMACISCVSAFVGVLTSGVSGLVSFAILFFWIVPLIVGFTIIDHYRARKRTVEKRKSKWTDNALFLLFVAFPAARYIWGINPLEPFAPFIIQHGATLMFIISILLPCLLASAAWRWIASPDTIETIDLK